MDWLDKLRAQPRGVRAQISLWAALGITGVIATVWVTTLPARFVDDAPITVVPKAEEREETSQKLLHAFGDVKAQAASVFESMRRFGASDETTEDTQPGTPNVPDPQERAEQTAPPSSTVPAESPVILIGTSTRQQSD